jgi:hypothetical protein
MSQILSTQLHNVVISANIGIMIFFTVIVAPTVFKVLPAQWSAKYVRAFFPKYYAQHFSTRFILLAFDSWREVVLCKTLT